MLTSKSSVWNGVQVRSGWNGYFSRYKVWKLVDCTAKPTRASLPGLPTRATHYGTWDTAVQLPWRFPRRLTFQPITSTFGQPHGSSLGANTSGPLLIRKSTCKDGRSIRTWITGFARTPSFAYLLVRTHACLLLLLSPRRRTTNAVPMQLADCLLKLHDAPPPLGFMLSPACLSKRPGVAAAAGKPP